MYYIFRGSWFDFFRSLAILCGFSLLFVIAVGSKLGELCAFPTPQNKCMSANRTDGYRVACSGGFHDDFSADEWVSRVWTSAWKVSLKKELLHVHVHLGKKRESVHVHVTLGKIGTSSRVHVHLWVKRNQFTFTLISVKKGTSSRSSR